MEYNILLFCSSHQMNTKTTMWWLCFSEIFQNFQFPRIRSDHRALLSSHRMNNQELLFWWLSSSEIFQNLKSMNHVRSHYKLTHSFHWTILPCNFFLIKLRLSRPIIYYSAFQQSYQHQHFLHKRSGKLILLKALWSTFFKSTDHYLFDPAIEQCDGLKITTHHFTR